MGKKKKDKKKKKQARPLGPQLVSLCMEYCNTVVSDPSGPDKMKRSTKLGGPIADFTLVLDYDGSFVTLKGIVLDEQCRKNIE